MLDQRLAKLLFCGVCLTLFPSHADYVNSLDRYGYTSMQYQNDTEYLEPTDDIPPVWDEENQLSMLDAYTDYPRNYDSQPEFIQPEKVRLGLQYAIDYLQNYRVTSPVTVSGVSLSNQQLVKTAKSLLNWSGELTPSTMEENFYLIDLQRGDTAKSKFTGYYTPIISAQLYPNEEYRYPIYSSPMSNQRGLSREQISAGALSNKGLEIAWTNDPLGLFYIQIQGSGIIELPSGERKSLKFDGSNDKPFRSIATYMKNQGLLNSNPSRKAVKQWLDANPRYMNDILNINPRYIYFTLGDDVIKTASGTPIVTGHTVAVDTKHIPFGSVILAEVPVINSLGQTVGKEWRMLFPQDRGNAIKGAGRMDIYTGVGESARQMANSLTGYGKAYLLLSKPEYNGEATISLNNRQNIPHIPTI
ncbi:MAG: hypothetical protein DSZ29_03220 [Aquificaceae bacterium]|nr:MAG: hypothetical protein DSZ29_03220 [Aquificaceae bacterium]